MADSNDSGLKKKLGDHESMLRDCEQLEEDLAALRAAYEQYFLGVERHPPQAKHRDIKKRIMGLKNIFVRSTAAKFRLQGLQQKFVTYERLWSRTLMEMENGTYHRDVFKAKLRAKAEAKTVPPEAKTEPPKSAVSAPPVPAAARTNAPVGSAGGLSDDKLKAVFDAYVTAKKRCNEDVSKLNYDSLATTLKKQVPELLKKHNAKSVDFKVVIKDGKAVLKAVPRE